MSVIGRLTLSYLKNSRAIYPSIGLKGEECGRRFFSAEQVRIINLSGVCRRLSSVNCGLMQTLMNRTNS